MFSFLVVAFICLILVISLSILAFGDTKTFRKLQKHCNICPTTEGACKDRCLDFISTKLSDKCRMLPQEIEMLNDHLRGISEMVYVIGEMHKCYEPGMQTLKCQLLENAKQIWKNLPRDMPNFSSSINPSGGASVEKPNEVFDNQDICKLSGMFKSPMAKSPLHFPSQLSGMFKSPMAKSPLHFPSLVGDKTTGLRLSNTLPSPHSTCSLSLEDVGRFDGYHHGPCRYVCCNECFEQSTVEQAIKYIENSLKEHC